MKLRITQTSTSVVSILDLGPYKEEIKKLPYENIKSGIKSDSWTCDVPDELFEKILQYNADVEGISIEEATKIFNELC